VVKEELIMKSLPVNTTDPIVTVPLPLGLISRMK
jgi:hypothetical protein